MLSPRNLPDERVILLAVKSYFDGSISVGKSMTLAGIGADENTWAEIEGLWDEVRRTRGNPSHIHMTYLMDRVEIYKGWSVEDRDHLVDGLLNVLLSFRGHPRIRSFSTSVDLTAHKDLSGVKRLPVPERLCTRIVVPCAMEWYFGTDVIEFGKMEVFFDRNEGFMRHIEPDWTSKAIRKRDRKWELINSITQATMQYTTALQITDVLAWGRNRLSSGSHWETDSLYIPAVRACGSLKGFHIPLDRETLAKGDFSKEEGFAAINPQRNRGNSMSEEFKRFDRMMREVMRASGKNVKQKIEDEKKNKKRKKSNGSSSSHGANGKG